MRKVLYILGQLTDEDVEWLAKNGKCRDLPDGSFLTQEDKPVNQVLVILKGTAEVLIDEGKRAIATLGVGEIVGEISLVDRRPATASVRNCGEMTCLVLEHAALMAKFKTDTAFAARFYRSIAMFMADRMRSTMLHLSKKSTAASGLAGEDELDEDVLDNLHLAGNRFEMILDKLANG